MSKPEIFIEKDIFNEIHKHTRILPKPIRNFYKVVQHYSFTGEVRELRKQLYKFKSESPKQIFFKNLFLGLCQHFLGDPNDCLKHLKDAENMNLYPEIMPLIVQLKYEILYLKKILLVISYDYSLNYNFFRLKKINRNITVQVLNKRVNLEKLIDNFNTFNQVFLLGHGDDRRGNEKAHIQLANKFLYPKMLEDYLTNNKRKPAVFGIFSCGNGFLSPNIINRVDYFITDNEISVPEFSEMFIYGYLREYYKEYDILNAFKKGRIATIFRAKNDRTYEIRARGTKLK